MSAVGAGLFGGAIGGGLAVTVLAPLTAANNFLGSYFFGSGMILGERQMYQDDWIKIKKRLDAGESFLIILEEVMKPNTQAVMQMARETVIAVSDEWNDIVLKYLQSIPQSIWDAINKINAGEPTDNPWPLGEGVIGKVNGRVQCAAGWHEENNKCIRNQVVQQPTPEPKEGPKKPTSPGTQPIVRVVPRTYNVSASALKLYIAMSQKLDSLNKTRQIYLTSQLARIRNNRKALLADVDRLRENVIRQINLMRKNYPDIEKAYQQWLAKFK